MTNPHQALIEEISKLSNEQIAAKELWEIIAIGIPRGEVEHIAKNLILGGKPVAPSTVRSWRNDPNADSTTDPWGRGSPAEHFEQFMTALYSRFPEGAWLILKWHLLKFAEKQAIHGHDGLLNALEANDEACSLLEQVLGVLRGQTRKPK